MDVVSAPNYIRLLITSNHDWVVPAGAQERRFLVLDVSDAVMQNKEYFGALVDEMNNGGREALLQFLMAYDYSDIDLRTIPKTGALLEQKLQSMTMFEKFWLDCLMSGAISDDDSCWWTNVADG